MKTIGLIFFSILIFIPAFTAAVSAQENCGLNEPPALLNLKLNMTPEQVQSVFGRELKISVKNADEKNIFQNYIKQPAPPILASVRALYLRFFNRRLYQLEVFFEDAQNIKTLADFTDSLSAKYNFPPSQNWKTDKGKSLINCTEFTISADKILNPRVEITDNAGRAAVETARKEKKKKK